MKNTTILILILIISNLNLNGQTRIISGRVVSEDLEPLPGLNIENSNNILLGKTDIDGRFTINVPQEIDSLLFRYIGFEWADIRLLKDCDTVEVVLMHEFNYCFMSSRRVDRLRKKRFNNLLKHHSDAVKKGLFENNNLCYDRAFEAYKPDLDSIGKVLKRKRKANKNDFKNLNIGDIVKIPFGVDSSGKRVSTTYVPCRYCTEKDYGYLIGGEIVNKNRDKLTLEITINQMPYYDSLEYRGDLLSINANFKYEMKYFAVILDK